MMFKNFSHYIQFYGPKLNIENKKKSENQNIVTSKTSFELD